MTRFLGYSYHDYLYHQYVRNWIAVGLDISDRRSPEVEVQGLRLQAPKGGRGFRPVARAHLNAGGNSVGGLFVINEFM